MTDSTARPGEANEAQARRALAAIPVFAPADIAAARITRLRGLTNRVFKVETGPASFSLRIPGSGTAALIDRRSEEANARAAARAGVAPDVLHFGADGVMLTPFIEGATLSPKGFRERRGAIMRTAAALRRLHREAAGFSREFRVLSILRDYVRRLEAGGFALPQQFGAAIAGAEAAGRALALHAPPLRPCHCDPTGANLIDTGSEVVLIDWEYSAMNDPAWDLAYLSIEAEFDVALDRELLAAYLGRPPNAPETGRIEVTKVLCETLSATWALVQHMNGNRSADFARYAEATFERCQARLDSNAFARHLAAIRQG